MSEHTERNEQDQEERLDDVLNEYLASTTEPNAATLAEWVRLYPEYKQQLTDLTVNWSLMEWLPAAGKIEPVDEDTLVLRAMSVIQNMQLGQVGSPGGESDDTEAPLQSLFDEGRALGLTPQQLADKVKMNRALMGKLNRRLIRPGSIPHAAIEALAAVVHRPILVVTNFLQRGPRFAPGDHKSAQAPALRLEEFAEAVLNDSSLSEEHRAYWLEILSREAETKEIAVSEE
ncbi:MAG TPA: hypothetical protein VGE45_18670 [Chloroflexia bacterium]|jgi:hypothetical protein